MPTAAPDVLTCAEEAGLTYVSDDTAPGIRRRRAGTGFAYRDARGKPVRDPEVLARIRGLAVPPAWTDVWICSDASGHIQAVGRDLRGRKQYRYHPRWREVRDGTKYERMLAFGAVLPAIRARVARDLARPELDREKVLATVVRLLDTTHIRIGNPEYASTNNSYGLTTLQDRHVKLRGQKLDFAFKGKSGKQHRVRVDDARLARIVRDCRDIPGQDLFQYYDPDGARHPIGSGDVNTYLRACSGDEFSAKDFRTFAGTVLAARALAAGERPDKKGARKQALALAIEQVASSLGNTPTVCRKCYIHPAVLDAYEAGVTAPASLAGKQLQPYKALRQDERRAVALLLHWQKTAKHRDLGAKTSSQLAASLRPRKAA